MREYTTILLQAIDDGIVEAKDVVLMAMKYMSEDEVHDMMDANELTEYLEDAYGLPNDDLIDDSDDELDDESNDDLADYEDFPDDDRGCISYAD